MPNDGLTDDQRKEISPLKKAKEVKRAQQLDRAKEDLELKYGKGLTYPQLAEKWEMTVGGAKLRVRRAKKAIASEMDLDEVLGEEFMRLMADREKIDLMLAYVKESTDEGLGLQELLNATRLKMEIGDRFLRWSGALKEEATTPTFKFEVRLPGERDDEEIDEADFEVVDES